MKILLGSHGTGKSTLLKAVQDQHPNYYITDGFSRPVYKIARLLDLSNNQKQLVINELSAWAYGNYLSHTNVISARSIVDCIVYSNILAPDIDIKGLRDLFEKTKTQVEYFFYIPIEFEYVVDEGRPAGMWKELQGEIDNSMRKFIESHIPPSKLITLIGSVESRYNQISKYL